MCVVLSARVPMFVRRENESEVGRDDRHRADDVLAVVARACGLLSRLCCALCVVRRLFIKGSPSEPKCKFSKSLIRFLMEK